MVRWVLTLVARFAAGPSVSCAQMPAPAAARTATAPAVEEVLVTGEHPGPGMWQVTHGEHTLWILGTHAPLPQRLAQAYQVPVTNDHQVTKLIAEVPMDANAERRGVAFLLATMKRTGLTQRLPGPIPRVSRAAPS